EKLLANKLMTARASNALSGFLHLISDLAEKSHAIDIHGDTPELDVIAKMVLEDTGLLDFHQNEKGEKGQARAENLQELVNACRAFSPDDGAEEDASVLQIFLDTAALDAGDNQADEFEDAVQLMTLHSAKGLEFPLVFLAGVEEGLFPHKMSADDPDRLEEERRLAYVGITRAMQKLVITYAETRRLFGSETSN